MGSWGSGLERGASLDVNSGVGSERGGGTGVDIVDTAAVRATNELDA